MNACFSVLESRWWTSGNHSVRPIFEAVAAIHYENPSSFLYDMFADRSSLSTVIESRATDARTEVVYLASHGDEANIYPTDSKRISRTVLRNSLARANKKGQVKGIYLGTCMTGNGKVASFFLNHKAAKLQWLAGYSGSVDWIDGTAIDMVFFSKLAALQVSNKSRKKKLTHRQMAHQAATHLIKVVPGAHATYGFNIFFKERNGLSSMFG